MLTLRQTALRALVITGIAPITIAMGFPAASQADTSPTGGDRIEETAVAEARAIVLEQLKALQNNDEPSTDAGIRTAWKYAHPNNQEATGPLTRFVRMLKSPSYRDLINHQSHRVTLIRAAPNAATFEVVIYPGTMNAPLLFYWSVAKVESGDRIGKWATTAVSAPVEIGSPSA